MDDRQKITPEQAQLAVYGDLVATAGARVGEAVGGFYAKLATLGVEPDHTLYLTKMWAFHVFDLMAPKPGLWEINGDRIEALPGPGPVTLDPAVSDAMFDRIMAGVADAARRGVREGVAEEEAARAADAEQADDTDDGLDDIVEGDEWKRGRTK